MGTRQDVYAANLLQDPEVRRHGYPLHSPAPRGELEEPYQTDGFQIGDVGYITNEGEFNPLFNICSRLPDERRKQGYPEHKPIDFAGPYKKSDDLSRGQGFMVGMRRGSKYVCLVNIGVSKV